MGFIFEENMAEHYAAWSRSRLGQAIESAIENTMLSLISPKPGDRVLDVGCGSGNHLLLFNRMGLDVSGIDASPLMIKQAQARLGNRCILRSGLAEDLPFEDNEFDYVILINTLEFVQDPLQVLFEAGRVAYKKVFIGVFNRFSWAAVLSKIPWCSVHPLLSFARFFDLWEIKYLLRQAYGNLPVEWRCISPVPSFLDKFVLWDRLYWCNRLTPLGLFLGISVTMQYSVRTDNLSLPVELTGAGRTM